MRLSLLSAALLLLAPAVAQAQSVAIRHAVYVPKTSATPAHVELVFAAIFETPQAVADAGDAKKYRIVDLYAGPGRTYAPKELTIARAVVPALSWLEPEQLNTVQLFLAADLPAPEDDRYIVIVTGLQFGKKAVPSSVSPTRITMRLASPTAVTPQWVKAKDKDTSDVYFSGSVSRSEGQDFYGTADVKLRYPIAERTIGQRLHWFAPAFDLAASANPNADPDSLRLGFTWQFFPIARTGGSIPITRWENAVDHEASRNFDYRTLVWRSEWLFLPAAWRVGETGWFWINPLVGIAAGRILEVPEDAFDDGALFRLLAGGSATLEVPVAFAKTLSVNAEYQFREQFQDELAGAKTLGRGSHRWSSIKAELAFNDFVSFGVAFQDGEQPPKYKAVKRNLMFDLTFKAARKNKAR